VEKYGTTGQATGDNVIRRMHFANWIVYIRLRMHTQSNTAFPLQHWLCECYPIRTSPTLFLRNKTFDLEIDIYLGL
jgi:hypothetical protein